MCHRDGYLDSPRYRRPRSRGSKATWYEVAVRLGERDCTRIGYCGRNSKPRSRPKVGADGQPVAEHRVRPARASLVSAVSTWKPSARPRPAEPGSRTRLDVFDRIRRVVQRALRRRPSIWVPRGAGSTESTRSDPRTSSRRTRPPCPSRQTGTVLEAGRGCSGDRDGAARKRNSPRRETEGVPCHVGLLNGEHSRIERVTDSVRAAASGAPDQPQSLVFASFIGRQESRSQTSSGRGRRWGR
jgi:hypothetical protein